MVVAEETAIRLNWKMAKKFIISPAAGHMRKQKSTNPGTKDGFARKTRRKLPAGAKRKTAKITQSSRASPSDGRSVAIPEIATSLTLLAMTMT